MTEHRKTEPPMPWWYAPVGGTVTGGALAVPALDFPWNLVVFAAVMAWYGLYLGHHQRRSDLPQGIGKGRHRVVEIAFIVVVLTLMVLTLVVSFLNLPRAAALSLVLTGFVVGFFYPSAWNAAR